jgi:hypothetical protein
MKSLKLRYYGREVEADQSHRWCVLCGKAYTRYELDFYSGSVEPVEGETLTGATSAETGIIEDVNLVGGSYAGGDAHGTIVFTAASGSSDFEVDELINGSSGGDNIMTVRCSTQRRHGRLYPTRALILREGRYYCKPHYRYRFRPRDRDKQKIQIRESNDD